MADLVARVSFKDGGTMKKKSEAQLYLEQPERLDIQIRNKLAEQQQWRDLALGITANMEGERVQSSGTQSKMANAVVKCVDMEREIDSLIDKLVDIKKDVISTIEQIGSASEYELLHLRYIQRVPLKDIAIRWNTEYTNVTSCHGRALKNVQAILNAKK
jgi:hypothetical protein